MRETFVRVRLEERWEGVVSRDRLQLDKGRCFLRDNTALHA